MIRCSGGECPLQQNCALKDAYVEKDPTDLVELQFPPFDPATATCPMFLSNGYEDPPSR